MKKAFSLIELLIVISIMAILGSLALAAFSTARKQGRDSVRKSDMTQYKVALEQYYSTNGAYPVSALVNSETCSGCVFSSGTSDPLTSYMGGNPPNGISIPNKKYYYISDSTGTSYALFADLEIGFCWEICSNGRSGDVGFACSNITTVSCQIP